MTKAEKKLIKSVRLSSNLLGRIQVELGVLRDLSTSSSRYWEQGGRGSRLLDDITLTKGELWFLAADEVAKAAKKRSSYRQREGG